MPENSNYPPITEIHQRALDILLAHREKLLKENKEFTFKLRQKNNENRLDRGYWFQGYQDYVAISPYRFNNHGKKTPSLFFNIKPSGEGYIELRRSFLNKHYPSFYKELLQYLNDTYNDRKDTSLGTSYLLCNKNSNDEWIKHFKNFFEKDVLKINEIAKNLEQKLPNLSKHLFVPKDKFQKYLKRIEAIQKKENANELTEETSIQSPTNNQNLSSPKEALNQILYGPPGTGKTYQARKLAQKIVENEQEQITFVTFHQSFSYEDFVEGIKATTGEEGTLGYQIQAGVFQNICKAAENTDQPYVLIIDEINRGNISRIFGELITLIEPSKRKGETEEIAVTLPYTKAPFSVPSNLYIIGTMNTADRSLTQLDIALRRRFQFIEMMPRYDLLETIDDIDLSQLLQAINSRICQCLDREHQIGHSFLMEISSLEKLKIAFQYHILPLLEEYFFDDWNKIKLILNDNTNHFFYPKNEPEWELEQENHTPFNKCDWEAIEDDKFKEALVDVYKGKEDNQETTSDENTDS